MARGERLAAPLLSLRHTHSLGASQEQGGPRRGLTLTQRTREAEEEGERKQRSFAQGSAVAIWSSLSGWWPKLPGEEKLENVLLLVYSSVEGAAGGDALEGGSRWQQPPVAPLRASSASGCRGGKWGCWC